MPLAVNAPLVAVCHWFGKGTATLKQAALLEAGVLVPYSSLRAMNGTPREPLALSLEAAIDYVQSTIKT